MLCLIWDVFQAVSVLSAILTILCIVAIRFIDADLITTFWSKFGKKPESLQAKVVWITGASTGIGECIAYQLTQAGCRVVLTSRREEKLNDVKEGCLASAKCKTQADDIMVLPLDVMKLEEHKAAVQKVMDRFGYIDILVNNAGRGMRGCFWEVDPKVDKEIFTQNVLGGVHLTQLVLPHMIKRRSGHIVATASIVGILPAPRIRCYTGSKHAVMAYYGSLRNEVTEHNIDVTLVMPGPVDSGFDDRAISANGGLVEQNARFPRQTTERCAELYCVAIANKMYESWVCVQPQLNSCYLNQYFPNFLHWYLRNNSMQMVTKIGMDK